MKEDEGLETIIVRFEHWKNKGQPEPPYEGWRANIKCDFCKKYKSVQAEDHSLDGLMRLLQERFKRPLCEECDKKIRQYKTN